MKLPRQRSDEQRAIERARAAGPLDSGETRAIMIGSVVLIVFLYFIKLILLPFVLAGIIAYILTPPLDWAAKRSGLPRALLAVVLFLILFGFTALMFLFAGQRLLVEARGIAGDLQGIIENLTRQAVGDGPITMFGSTVSPHDIAQSALTRLRDWIGQSDQIGMLTEYSLAFVMGSGVLVNAVFFRFAARRGSRDLPRSNAAACQHDGRDLHGRLRHAGGGRRDRCRDALDPREDPGLDPDAARTPSGRNPLRSAGSRAPPLGPRDPHRYRARHARDVHLSAR